ncbi:ORF26 [Ranid herpesvirus 2]|uniref:ORF26 n=1 Tax=Ranid herpesvirus 2 TaxID=389214 RepID=Q14W80_9VIRU|nr:ORF26 [Ranid herpesvirus 2]ABG25626.1 ORF26 [Ranid herpesvirus 2]
MQRLFFCFLLLASGGALTEEPEEVYDTWNSGVGAELPYLYNVKEAIPRINAVREATTHIPFPDTDVLNPVCYLNAYEVIKLTDRTKLRNDRRFDFYANGRALTRNLKTSKIRFDLTFSSPQIEDDRSVITCKWKSGNQTRVSHWEVFIYAVDDVVVVDENADASFRCPIPTQLHYVMELGTPRNVTVDDDSHFSGRLIRHADSIYNRYTVSSVGSQDEGYYMCVKPDMDNNYAILYKFVVRAPGTEVQGRAQTDLTVTEEFFPLYRGNVELRGQRRNRQFNNHTTVACYNQGKLVFRSPPTDPKKENCCLSARIEDGRLVLSYEQVLGTTTHRCYWGPKHKCPYLDTFRVSVKGSV